VGEVEDVRHRLGGMVDVALQVYHGGAVGQHAGREAFVEGLRHFALVFVAFAEIHVVTDADRLGKEAYHVRGFPYRLSVGNLALAFV